MWDDVQQVLADPAYERDAEQEVERLTRRLAGHDREIQRLLDAYQAEAMTVEELKQRRQQIEQHRAQVVERLHHLEHQRDDREDQLRLIQGAELFCNSIQQALVDPSFATKQQVLQLVVDRIVVAEDELVVHHIIPAGPFRLQTERNLPRRPNTAVCPITQRKAHRASVQIWRKYLAHEKNLAVHFAHGFCAADILATQFVDKTLHDHINARFRKNRMIDEIHQKFSRILTQGIDEFGNLCL